MSRAMRGWIVVADDLTGAAEVGAAARRRGLTVALTRGGPVGANEPEAQVWVIDTDTRERPAAEAAEAVRAWAEQLKRVAGGRRIFKKIDSVLRGACGLETETLAGVWGSAELRVVAGNPRRGREVRGGLLAVDGVWLDRTVFADDPTFPARSAVVAAVWAARGATGRVATRIADEVTAETLPGLARGAVESGALATGALDFFEACLEAAGEGGAALDAPELPAGGGALVVCGSRAGWAQREDFFKERGWPVAERSAPVAKTGARLLGIGAETAGEALAAARELAGLASAHIAETRPALICLEGGTTAAAVVAAAGWRSFELLGEVAPGTAGLRPLEAVEPAVVLVKPGSYAWPEAVAAAWARA
jgi:uncharacterized protein YgbK (DUF1537 family)